MNYDKILAPRLIELFDKYLGTGNIGTILKKSVDNIKKSDMIVPVLGMQGMGKSTLINGLLKENILPNDADETTCVPVEIKYGIDEKAEVYFKSSKEKEIVYTREELNTYVDNVCNPGNVKNVDRIVLYRKCDLLKNGLVLVDLPGVGSLTKANEETTTRYIKNLTTAIFVIPTVPTIRKKEAIFIKGVWSQFPVATFVQNDWGETAQEIADSLEYNQMRLKQISEEIKTPFNENIIVVNAYKAITGALLNDSKKIEESNIGKLVSHIECLAKEWQNNMESNINSKIKSCLESTSQEISKLITQANLSKEESRKERQKEYDEFVALSTTKIDELESAKREFRSKVESEMNSLKKLAGESAGELRKNLYKSIDNGVFDGELLDEEFKMLQESSSSNFFDEAIGKLNQLKFTFMEKLEEMSNVKELENDLKLEGEKVNKREKNKYERYLDNIGIMGGASAGAKIGALIGSGVPVIGTAIGAVVGSIIGFYAGSYIKKKIQAKRAAETKNAVDPFIDKFEESLKRMILTKKEELSKQVQTIIDDIIERLNDECVSLRNKISIEPNDDDLQLYRDDLSYLQTLERDL